MLAAIFQHTPIWVFALLFLIVWLGYVQTRTRTVSETRATVYPLIMLALSFSGVANAFPSGLAYGCWLLGLAMCAGTILRILPGVRASYDVSTRTYRLEGSWTPLAVMICIFLAKFVVAVILALHPLLVHDMAFSGSVALAYGLASGFFLARSLRLRRIARQSIALPLSA